MKIVKADDDGIKYTASVIRSGGVAIYPTETVYGLGCVPSDPDATKRILQLKQRADKPLPLICSSLEMAHKIVKFNATADKLAERFWPGPLMLILPNRIDYPIWVTMGKKTLGVRVSGSEVSRMLAELSAGVIVSTSANKSGDSPPLTAQEAINQVGEDVDVVVDGGLSQGQLPSTILDLSGSGSMIMSALNR